VDLYGCLGSDFIRAAIGTMCSVPAQYAGLSRLSLENAQWPPKTRINFLALKALVLLEYNLRGIYINASGQDVFNSLVLWAMEDLVPVSYFSETPLMDFIRKQTIEASSLLGSHGLESNQLLAELAQMAYRVFNSLIDTNGFNLWEIDYLSRLLVFTKPPAFSTQEAGRKETRSLAFKIFKSLKDPLDNSSDFNGVINRRLLTLLAKFKFELPRKSQEDFYASLFSEEPDS